MNGSSGFRGVPMTGGGNSGSSSTGNQNEMNSALRSHHPYFPRLESLTSPLYNAGELTPAGVAAAAAASRLFPAAHLSALHAAAVAAASVPQTTTTHHGMPPPSFSQFHQAAAAAAAAAANHHSVAAAHHPLLSPFLYSHLSSPAAFCSQPASATGSTPSTAPPPHFVGGHSRHAPYGSPVESAFMPAGNIVPPRYRYLLPSTTSPNTPTAPLAPPSSAGMARFPTTLPSDRSLSESEFASAAAAIARARRPSSPAKLTPPVTNVPTSSTTGSGTDSTWSSNSRPTLRIDQRPSNQSASTVPSAGLTSPDTKTSSSDAKKQKVSSGLLAQPYYPSHFMKGTVIQLANGELKRVEDLNTEDFVRSAHLTSELKIDTSQVVRIEEKSGDIVLLTFSVGGNKVQVSVEATVEHPFFVIGQGWSSFSPERSNNLYGLPCQRLQVGDVCISLTHRDVAAKASAPPVTSSNSSWSSGACHSSGSGPRSSAASTSPAAANSTTTKSDGHSSSTGIIKQAHPGNRTGSNQSEEDERSRKRRKTNLPLRLGEPEPSSQLVTPTWRYKQMDQRSAFTPPAVTTQTKKPPKPRRWSVS